MERAQLSTARGKERTQLIAARHAHHLSQDEVAAKVQVSKVTVHRWEREGDVPQPLHLRKLCKLYGKTAPELGFTVQQLEPGEAVVDVQTINETEHEEAEEECVLTTFRQHNLISRLMRILWNWPPGDARYQMLQGLILLELEDNDMNDDMSRRDALRFLALVPVDMLGLSQFGAVLKASHEDILKHCAAGIVACWKLRNGKELAFADLAVSMYIPTLKAIAQTAPMAQRKAAADLVAQCLLQKSALSKLDARSNAAIAYAQQAETYGEQAGSLLLRILALRTQAVAHNRANHWMPALQAAEKAIHLLEERDKQDKQKHPSASSQPAEEPLPQLVYSYVYAGLATYQARNGQKEDALLSLKKAHNTFSDEQAPIWIDHNQANLVFMDGRTHYHLGLYKEALDSFAQTRDMRDYKSEAGRVEIFIHEVMAEVSRDDQPRDMQWCIDRWTQGIQGAKELQSQQLIDEAIQAYTAMCIAWLGEKQVKNLREYIVD
jgi:transcriptional regulator with XRE-family HTH domain